MTKLNSEESHIPFVDGILSQLGIEMNEPSHDLRELKFSYLKPNSDLDKAVICPSTKSNNLVSELVWIDFVSEKIISFI